MAQEALFFTLIVLQAITLVINLVLMSGRKKKLEHIKMLSDICNNHFESCGESTCAACAKAGVDVAFDDELKEIEKKENQKIQE